MLSSHKAASNLHHVQKRIIQYDNIYCNVRSCSLYDFVCLIRLATCSHFTMGTSTDISTLFTVYQPPPLKLALVLERNVNPSSQLIVPKFIPAERSVYVLPIRRKTVWLLCLFGLKRPLVFFFRLSISPVCRTNIKAVLRFYHTGILNVHSAQLIL